MLYKEGDFVARHLQPVWGDRANYIDRIYIEEVDGEARWEQLWTNKTFSGNSIVCCIPAFVYDIDLGDEIVVYANGLFKTIVKSENYTFRLFLNEGVKFDSDLIRIISSVDGLIEPYSRRLYSVSIPGIKNAEAVSGEFLRLQEEIGYVYETGRTH